MASQDAVDDVPDTNELFRILTGHSADVDLKEKFDDSDDSEQSEEGAPDGRHAGIPLAYDEVPW